ncbi:MAG: aldehyde dehydrogenase family protein [Acidimicrobiia bacterium]
MTTTSCESRMLIDGKLLEAASGATFSNVNPATEEAIGDVVDAGAEDIDTAIAAARRAFDDLSWSEDHTFRQRCLEQLADALDRAREELRLAVVQETGCPIALTYVVQIEVPLSDIRYWAEQATAYEYERPMPDRDWMGTVYRRLIRREAAGVVSAITPWNFPLYLNIAKLGPALAAGNTVVLKPAPDTPWSATMLGKLIVEETDIPAGVVNIVTPSDHQLGEILTSDPRVDMVTFTGSTATGRRIMAAGSNTLKKIFLELGGKSAYIVLDDADLMAALPTAVGMVCSHAGQGCVIATRLLLPRSRYDEGVELAKTMMENIPYGDPTDPGIICGPVVNAKQRERVLGYIEKGKAEGARLVVGGSRPAQFDKGFFVEPTLFADVDPDSTIAQEEIFGPVLAVIPYDDDEDAVRIANNSRYGLSGMIHSGSDERAMAVARRVRTGTLSVNGGSWFQPDVPFGGYKQSGIGRENGKEGFEEYLEVKAIGLPIGD